ncbi:MAG: carbohydrate kinase [Planctomycetes bacterium]|nr:carbohydrate kinase [Planctomycetota bacterium]
MLDSALQELAQKIHEQTSQLQQQRVVGGFDGFIDEMITIIDDRENEQSYSAVETMTAFAEKLQAASGRSSLSEIDMTSSDAGGCAVNLCDVYNTMGICVDYFGTLGQPMHPAFADFAAACNSCHSWLDGHGTTLALEFNDGKYMLASMSDLHRFTPAVLETVLADGIFTSASQQAQLICMCNWTLYPHMTECWQYLQKHVYSTMRQEPFMFFDLVNPSSRSKEDQLAMLQAMQDFSQNAKVILGVNLNEAHILADTLGIQSSNSEEDLIEVTVALREKINIFEVVTHGIRENCVAGDGYVQGKVSGPYCEAPKKSTGAGDRFNAGYCLGHLMGVSAEERLQLGVASGGYFVRNAKSASLADVAGFIERWADDTLE